MSTYRRFLPATLIGFLILLPTEFIPNDFFNLEERFDPSWLGWTLAGALFLILVVVGIMVMDYCYRRWAGAKVGRGEILIAYVVATILSSFFIGAPLDWLFQVDALFRLGSGFGIWDLLASLLVYACCALIMNKFVAVPRYIQEAADNEVPPEPQAEPKQQD